MKKFFTLMLLAITFQSFAAEDATNAIETHLNNIQNFSADFVQIGANGQKNIGKFYMQKTGKIRWEYSDQPLLIVSSGSILTYFDKQLNEVTQIPASETLAGFLARDEIKFSGDIKLINFEETENSAKISITQTDKPQDGNLVMHFDKSPMQMTMLEVIDPNGEATKLYFNNQDFETKIAAEKFIFKNPNFHKDAWE